MNKPNRKISSSGNQQNREGTTSEDRDAEKEKQKNKFKNPEFVLPLPQTEEWARNELKCDGKRCKRSILEAEQYMHLLLQLDELWSSERSEKENLKKENSELSKETVAVKSELVKFEENNAHFGHFGKVLRQKDEQIANLKRELKNSVEEFEKKKREYRQEVDVLVKERDQARNEIAQKLKELEEERNQFKKERDEAISQRDQEIEDLRIEVASREQLYQAQQKQLSSALKRSPSGETDQPAKKVMLESNSDAINSIMKSHDDDIIFVGSVKRCDQKTNKPQMDALSKSIMPTSNQADRNPELMKALGRTEGQHSFGSSSVTDSPAIEQLYPSVPTSTVESSNRRHVGQNPASIQVAARQQPVVTERQYLDEGTKQLIQEFGSQLDAEVEYFINGYTNAEAFTEKFMMLSPTCVALTQEDRKLVRDHLLTIAKSVVEYVMRERVAPPQWY